MVVKSKVEELYDLKVRMGKLMRLLSNLEEIMENSRNTADELQMIKDSHKKHPYLPQ